MSLGEPLCRKFAARFQEVRAAFQSGTSLHFRCWSGVGLARASPAGLITHAVQLTTSGRSPPEPATCRCPPGCAAGDGVAQTSPAKHHAGPFALGSLAEIVAPVTQAGHGVHEPKGAGESGSTELDASIPALGAS